jgi:Ca2+-binding RTX toxin-like protein
MPTRSIPKRATALVGLAVTLMAVSGAVGAVRDDGGRYRRLYSPAAAGPIKLAGAPTALLPIDLEGAKFDDLVVTLAGVNRIEIIANHEGRLTHSTSAAVGLSPSAMALGPEEEDSILVAGAASNSARLFDIYERNNRPVFAPVGRVAVGPDPSAVVGSWVSIDNETPGGTVEHLGQAEFVVADRSSDDVSLVERDSTNNRLAVVGKLPVGHAPAALAGEPFGPFWVANAGSGTISWYTGYLFQGKMYTETTAVGGEPVALVLGNFIPGDYRDKEVAVLDRRAGQVDIVDRPSQVIGQPFEPYRVVARYPVGKEPVAAVAADLDEHLGLDLAVLNSGSNDVTVLLNRGPGHFVNGGTYPTGRHPVALAPVEYGPTFGPDLAIADRGSHDLSILVHNEFGHCGGRPARLRIGTPGIDIFGGTDDPEEAIGRAGNDRISAAAGNDCLRGQAGDDNLLGFGGNDSMWPGPGRDEVSGGSGNDTVFARHGGHDVIDCGKGIDTAYADPTDKLRECEHTP